MSFLDYITTNQLSDKSDFSQLSQAAIEQYYLIPYPGSKDKRPQTVNRRLHGAVHVTNVARHIEMFLELYQKYQSAPLLTDREIKLLKLAAIYHDSANTREIFHDEQQHAKRFATDMQILGFSHDEITPFAHAIEFKDAPYQTNPTFFQKILHDADSLDIIRLVGEGYQKEHLHICTDLQTHPTFHADLDAIISNWKDTCELFKNKDSSPIGKLHLECEFSENCYNSICNLEKELFLSEMIMLALSRGYDLSLEELPQNVSVLDLYTRSQSAEKYFQSMALEFSQPTKQQMSSDSVLEKYNHSGVYIRGIKSNTELESLDCNIEALERENIHTAQELRNYLEKQKQINAKHISTPLGFKWRPCSMIAKGIPITSFAKENALIIDPQESMPVYFYKRNVVSGLTANGTFDYTPTSGPKKDKTSAEILYEKLNEINQRRTGEIYDRNFKYYGKNNLSHNEVLMHYSKSNIIGIIVGDSKQDACSALILRAQIGQPLRPLYRYSAKNGLTVLSIDETLAQTGYLHRMIDPVEKYLQFIPKQSQQYFNLMNPEYYQQTYLVAKNPDFICEHYKRTLVITPNAEQFETILKYHQTEFKKYKFEKDSQNRVFLNSLKQDDLIEWRTFDDSIIIDFATITENSNKLNQYICEVIQNINDLILGQHPAYIQLKELDGIDATLINNIEREFNEKNQAVYFFPHPKYPELRCSMQIKDGAPMVSMTTLDGVVLEKNTELLPLIAKEYFRQLFNQVQELFINQPCIDDNLPNLKLEFNPNKKYPLMIMFSKSVDCSHEAQMTSLQKLLETTKLKPLENASNPKEIVYRIDDLDVLETLKMKFSSSASSSLNI